MTVDLLQKPSIYEKIFTKSEKKSKSIKLYECQKEDMDKLVEKGYFLSFSEAFRFAFLNFFLEQNVILTFIGDSDKPFKQTYIRFSAEFQDFIKTIPNHIYDLYNIKNRNFSLLCRIIIHNFLLKIKELQW